MTSLGRDLGTTPKPELRDTNPGRMYVVVVGIDRYRAWSKLGRAVSDAQGARKAFVERGFTELRPPLLDDAATGAALHRLVTDEVRTLRNDDSLVVFFAGHGHTVTTTYPDGTIAKRGYLIPVDAEPPTACSTWVSLENWLHEIAHLAAKHILVVIDACHSGIALNPVIRWRGEDMRISEPLAKLHARRSRRIITSALDDEQAMDSGPIEGHSLFTGCLIEALTGGLQAKTGQYTATGSEIALHVQRRVSSFPGGQQTPDFGALELDNRGELIIALSGALSDHISEPDRIQQLGAAHLGVDGILPRRYQSGNWPTVPAEPSVPESRDLVGVKRPPDAGVDSIRPKRLRSNPPATAATDMVVPTSAGGGASDEPTVVSTPTSSVPATTSSDPPAIRRPMAAEPACKPASAQTGSVASAAPAATRAPRAGGDAPTSASGHTVKTTSTRSPAEVAFISALDRHQAARRGARRVLTLVKADPMIGTTGWATWAASHGLLTLVTDATGFAAATASLLEQMPLLRMLRSARARLAAAAKLDANAFDEALDSRSASEHGAWIDKVAGHSVHSRVAGWLLSMIREPWGRVSDLAAAPIQGGDLFAALHDLSAPISVLFHHREPTAPWLERAIQTAAELVDFLPRCAIAVCAPDDLATSVLRGGSESLALALARQGEVPIAGRAIRAADADLGRTVQVLHAALASDPRTTGLFEPRASVPTHDRERPVEVDLIARDALLAVEIDDWYQFHDPKAYERDRTKDVWLSRAQFFVLRFLVEDIEDRIQQTVDEIAIGLAGRRASGSFVENSNDKQD